MGMERRGEGSMGTDHGDGKGNPHGDDCGIGRGTAGQAGNVLFARVGVRHLDCWVPGF